MKDSFLGLNYFWWLMLSLPFYGIGEYTSKLFAQTHMWYYVVIGILGYALGCLCWFPALMLRNELLVLDTIWKALAAGVTALLALLIFHERPSVVQYIGIVLVFIGILLVK